MSFLKCSNLEAGNAIHFNFAIKEIKGRIMIKKISRAKFLDGFYASENQN